MEKLTLKIDNLFWAIIECREYDFICKRNDYDNMVQPQKEVLKTIVIPKIKTIISEITSNNREYECIKLEKLASKYTKNDKRITLDFVYHDDRENVYVIAKIFENFKRDVWNSLLEYRLFVA